MGTVTWPTTLPPLPYVREKLHASLGTLHDLYRTLQELGPAELPRPPGTPAIRYALNDDALLGSVHVAFAYELTALLALLGKMELLNEQGLVDDLFAQSAESFRSWLHML